MLRTNALLRRFTNAETGYYFKEGSTIGPASLKPSLSQDQRVLSPLALADSQSQSQTRETRWRFQKENIQAQDAQRPLIRYNSVWTNSEIPIEQRIKFISSGSGPLQSVSKDREVEAPRNKDLVIDPRRSDLPEPVYKEHKPPRQENEQSRDKLVVDPKTSNASKPVNKEHASLRLENRHFEALSHHETNSKTPGELASNKFRKLSRARYAQMVSATGQESAPVYSRDETDWKSLPDLAYIKNPKLRRAKHAQLLSSTSHEPAPWYTEDVKERSGSGKDVTSVLRSILRECTYLPDPHARKYLKEHILNRFKRHIQMHHKIKDEAPDLTKARSRRQLSDAQDALKTLHQANAGYNKSLTQVLLMAYGRSGRRRYELLKLMMNPDPSYIDAITKSVQYHELDKAPDLAEGVPRFTRQLEALLESQRIQKPKLLTAGINPRTADPNPTKLNTKMRKTAKRRVANQLRDWYGTTVARLLPPLPAPEWEELSERATGGLKYVHLPPRARPKAGLDFKDFRPPALLESLGIVERRKVKSNKDRAHTLTARFMRRLWGRIFRMCPVMTWDASTEKWNVKWGEVSKLTKKQRDRKTAGDDPEAQAKVVKVKLGDFGMGKEDTWKSNSQTNNVEQGKWTLKDVEQGEWELKDLPYK